MERRLWWKFDNQNSKEVIGNEKDEETGNVS